MKYSKKTGIKFLIEAIFLLFLAMIGFALSKNFIVLSLISAFTGVLLFSISIAYLLPNKENICDKYESNFNDQNSSKFYDNIIEGLKEVIKFIR